MTEVLPPTITEEGEEQLSSTISQWADLAHLQEVEDSYQGLNPSSWSMHRDPTKEDVYYISGADSVVMEGLSYENASHLMSLVQSIPTAIESFQDLSKMWNIVGDEALESPDGMNEFFKLIHKYQLRIAQLEGNSSPVPEVTKASDLTFMHVGHKLRIPGSDGMTMPIHQVYQDPSGFTRVNLGSGNTVAYLPPDMEVSVQVQGRWEDGTQAPQPDDPTVGTEPPSQVDVGVEPLPSPQTTELTTVNTL